jgi:hypothetical protein
MPRPRLIPLSFSILALSLASCSREPGPGTVIVKFRLGNDKTCEELGVVNVRAFLGDDPTLSDAGDTDGGGPDLDVTAPCEDGEVTITQVPAGSYELTVQAIDAADVTIMDNLKDGALPVEVLGDGSQLTTDTIGLTNSPSQLKVRWDFGFSSCEAEGVGSFRIAAFDTTGTEGLHEVTIPCNTAGDPDDENYRLIDDPDRSIDGTVFGEVGIDVLDASNAELGMREVLAFTPPGPGYPIKISLACDATGCTSSGMPD